MQEFAEQRAASRRKIDAELRRRRDAGKRGEPLDPRTLRPLYP